MSWTTYFDFETSGLELTNPPIQLAAIIIKDSDWSEVAAFERKLTFDISLANPEALAMNHYDADVWAREAVTPLRVLSEFIAFTKPYLCVEMKSKRTGAPYYVGKLAGHNALKFDLPILQRMFGTSFFPFSYHVKDTLQRALFYFDEHPEVKRPENLKLSTLCEAMGISIDGAHDALADVRMSAALARAFATSEIRRLAA